MLAAILILLPVVLVLLYVYRMIVSKLQRRIMDRGDGIAILLAIGLTIFYMNWILQLDWSSSSPIWPTVLAPMGGYHIFAFGLLSYLYFRKIKGS